MRNCGGLENCNRMRTCPLGSCWDWMYWSTEVAATRNGRCGKPPPPLAATPRVPSTRAQATNANTRRAMRARFDAR